MEEEFHGAGRTCTGAWWSSTRADSFPSISASCSTSVNGGSMASQESHRAQAVTDAVLHPHSQFRAFDVAPSAMDWNQGLMRGNGREDPSSQDFISMNQLASSYSPLLFHGILDGDSNSQQSLYQECLLPNYTVSGEPPTQLFWESSVTAKPLNLANTNSWEEDHGTTSHLGQEFFHPLPRQTALNLIPQKKMDGRQESSSVVKRAASEPVFKKPRLETPSPLPTFKVRKEKLGDRITALQQLVSPFGKTDTASVLHEAIEYIKFLHEQVGVLSTPYLKNSHPMQHKVQGLDRSSDNEGCKNDLRSRGLCLVPIQSTYPMASDIPTDFWNPTFGGSYR